MNRSADDEKRFRRREFTKRTALGLGGFLAAGSSPRPGDPRRRALVNDQRAEAGNVAPNTVTVEGDDSDRTTRARAVQSAIDAARAEGKSYVVVPSNFGPGVDGYDATSVDFHQDVQMLREGNLVDVYDVKAYGAAGDFDPRSNSGTDDTAAINATANQIRAVVRNGGFIGTAGTRNPHHEASAALHFPAGLFQCDGSVWLGVDAAGGEDYDDGVKNVTAARGAVIVSRNKGGVAVDATGVFNLRVSNLTVFGHRSDTPKVGWLNARSGTSRSPIPPSSGAHRFHDTKLIGHYRVAALCNYASEMNRWVNCEFRNSSREAHATLYLTRDNARNPVQSSHTTVNTEQGYSNYAPVFVSCDIRFDVPGDDSNAAAIVESGTWGPKFYNCYFDLLQSQLESPPVVRERSGASESGISRRSQGISMFGCIVENDYDSVLRVEGSCQGYMMQDCNLGGAGPDTAEIVVGETGELRSAEIQTYRGGTRVERISYDIRGRYTRSAGRGSVMVPEAETSARVEHGLDGDHLALSDISVTPTNDLGRASTFWVAELDGEGFSVHLDAEPGPDGAQFVWRADLG